MLNRLPTPGDILVRVRKFDSNFSQGAIAFVIDVEKSKGSKRRLRITTIKRTQPLIYGWMPENWVFLEDFAEADGHVTVV